MGLADELRELMQLEAQTSEMADKYARDPSGRIVTDSDRWEYVFRQVTALQHCVIRLAEQIDRATGEQQG